MNAESVCISVHHWFVLLVAATGCSISPCLCVSKRDNKTPDAHSGRNMSIPSANVRNSGVFGRLYDGSPRQTGSFLKQRHGGTEATEWGIGPREVVRRSDWMETDAITQDIIRSLPATWTGQALLSPTKTPKLFLNVALASSCSCTVREWTGTLPEDPLSGSALQLRFDITGQCRKRSVGKQLSNRDVDAELVLDRVQDAKHRNGITAEANK